MPGTHQAASTARGEVASGDEVVRVPLLRELLTLPGALERSVWVDLGSVQHGLLARLQNRRARLLVVDQSRARIDGRKDWYRPDALLPPEYWDETVDFVLCWDLLNYMNADQLARFSVQVAGHATGQTRLHALIHYSNREMPDQPCHCRLAHGDELHRNCLPGASVQAPRYSPKALEKAMPEWSVERTILLNNGMQEFVFVARSH